MYLFIFSLLLILFQFVNSKSIIEDYDKKLTKLEERETAYKDSIASLKDENFELMRFSLEFNDDAMSYFEDQGYKISEIVPYLKSGGAASVPALSPLSAHDAFSTIEATFASVGLKVMPYHASIPSLGQMSFLLLGRDRPPAGSLLPSGTRYVDDAALAELFAEPRDVESRPAPPALLYDQSIVRRFWAAR
jgi:hypothetical protein